MNPQDMQDPLSQLQDIHLPPAIGLWPPAWGWWLLLLILLATVALAIFFLARHKRRNGYRQLALQELQQIQRQYSAQQSAEYLQAMTILLRRTAISGFAAQFDPSIKGDAWLAWLDRQLPAASRCFSLEPGRVLALGPYQKQPAVDRDQVQRMVELWIRKHRNPWQQKADKNAHRPPAVEVRDHV